LMPAADCTLRTAVRVAGPRDPSTSREAPRSLRLVCRVRTAWPRSPSRSLGCEDELPEASSGVQVVVPTTPSTPIREADWWFLTARRVAEPKTPSTASEAPCAFRRVCRCFTAAPRAPSRSLTLLYVVVGADGARAGATPRM